MTCSTRDFADDVERLLTSDGEELTHEELIDRLTSAVKRLSLLKNLHHYLTKNYDPEQWDHTTREILDALDQL